MINYLALFDESMFKKLPTPEDMTFVRQWQQNGAYLQMWRGTEQYSHANVTGLNALVVYAYHPEVEKYGSFIMDLQGMEPEGDRFEAIFKEASRMLFYGFAKAQKAIKPS